MSGRAAQRGFIFQSIIAMIECLERDDWDEVKLEPDTDNDKVDIQLYKDGKILSAIQVKSSTNPFERSDVSKWLEELKKEATGAKEVSLCLVGDLFAPSCTKYITLNPEIKRFPFSVQKVNCRIKLLKYIADTGLDTQVNDDELQIAYNNCFAEIHNNSISNTPLNRETLNHLLKRVLSIPKCLTAIPDVNRDVGIIGRDEVMRELRNMLDQNGCIALISGLGGIGKTAVMRWICSSIAEDGNTDNHVAWITCGETLRDDILLLRDAFGIPSGDKEETAYRKTIQKLKRFRGTLYLFMDNMFREPDKEEISIINSLQPNVHIMISSRHNIKDIPVITLDVLDREPTIMMFYKYYGRDQRQIFKNIAESIIDTVHRHTLLVELLAKAAGRSEGTLEDFNERLKSNGFFDVFKRQIETEHDKYLTIEDSVIKLYEISNLTEAQQHIMKLFTIFTAEKEIYHKVIEWAELDSKAMYELVDLAWLEQGGLENGFHIHQIIKDSLTRRMKRDGAKLKIEAYGELVKKVANTRDYMPRGLEYTKAHERLTLTEDIARYVNEIASNIKSTEACSKQDYKLIRDNSTLINNMAVVYKNLGAYKKALEYFNKALTNRGNIFGINHLDIAMTCNNIASVYVELGIYKKALEYYGKAQIIIENQEGDSHLASATLYNNIASVYYAKGNFDKALEYYGKALVIRERFLGICNLETASTYNNMAAVYYAKGDYEKSLEYYDKDKVISERLLGNDHPDTATVYNNIALSYYAIGDYTNAEKYLDKALTIRKRILGIGHPEIATTYNNIGSIYGKKGNYIKAQEFYNTALKIVERTFERNHPLLGTILNNLAKVHYEMEDYEEALLLYEKALSIRKELLGDDHPETASTYNNIASVYEKQARFENALDYYSKARTIRENALGSDHPDTASTYNNMGSLYYVMGDFTNAMKYFLKANYTFERVFGSDHPETAKTYINIAVLFNEQGKYINALKYYEKASIYNECVLGIDHPSTAALYNKMAGVYEDQGDYTKAQEYYSKALAIRRRVLGDVHPDTAETYNDIAGVYRAQGAYEKALLYYDKALTIAKRSSGEDHQDTAATYNNIACVYREQGDYGKALEYYEKALTIAERVLGNEHSNTAATYNNMAGVYEDKGAYEKALEYYEKALKIAEKVLGREHPNTAATCNNMADVFRKRGEYDKAKEYYERALAVFMAKLGENHPYTQDTELSVKTMELLIGLGICEEELVEIMKNTFANYRK